MQPPPVPKPEIAGMPAGTCNNCGSHDDRELYAAGRAQTHRIVQCTGCGLMYAHPLEVSNLKGYLVPPDPAQPLTDDSPDVSRGRDKLPDYLAIEPVLSAMLPNRGRVIEVGTYSGLLLEHFRRAGWDVLGIEPNGRGVEYARRRFGIDVRQGTLESVTLEPGSAAAVVMLHVIEHVEDPASSVRAIRRLLQPGGVFVVETPTYDSLAYRLLGRRERSLSCNGHVFFYTERTLSALLTQTGLEIVRIQRVGRTMSWARLLWNLGVMSKSAWLQRKLAGLSEGTGLGRRRLYLNAHDMIRIYARKGAG